MNILDFDYLLPDGQVAQSPSLERGRSRLLVLERASGAVTHTAICELPRFLRKGDVLVVNNTRVYPARLLGHRLPTGGHVECLLLRRIDAERWEALMHPGQKLRVGERVRFENGSTVVVAEVLERKFYGRRIIRLSADRGVDIDSAIDAIGHVPLPPYIRRPDQVEDRERYQTIYASIRGSIAAPTAGLHFTPDLLRELQAGGVARVEITLHVGYGTFEPIRTEQVEQHTMDSERFEINDEAASIINAALDDGRRVIAVGTTTTRALETVGREREGRMVSCAGSTDLFIYPGFEFRTVGGLLTNFHLPRSSLLLLVCAFAGRERVLAAYQEAIERGYRFYSYGDAMLIL